MGLSAANTFLLITTHLFFKLLPPYDQGFRDWFSGLKKHA